MNRPSYRECFSAAPQCAITITSSALSSSIDNDSPLSPKQLRPPLGLPAENLEEYRKWGMYLE